MISSDKVPPAYHQQRGKSPPHCMHVRPFSAAAMISAPMCNREEPQPFAFGKAALLCNVVAIPFRDPRRQHHAAENAEPITDEVAPTFNLLQLPLQLQLQLQLAWEAAECRNSLASETMTESMLMRCSVTSRAELSMLTVCRKNVLGKS